MEVDEKPPAPLHARELDEERIRQQAKGRYNPRVAEVVEHLIDHILTALQEKNVKHDEFKRGLKFMAQTQEAGEIPLLIMANLEADHVFALDSDKPGSDQTVLGPFYLEGAPALERPYKLPMRDDEPGDPLVAEITVTDLEGTPIEGAVLDTWQADNYGAYSGYHGDAPEWNLRGKMKTDENGKVVYETVRPGPYPIPDQGPTGRLLHYLGRHSWRPAHLHYLISKEGYETLTEQLYFEDDAWLDSDSVGAVRDSLIIDPDKDEEGRWRVEYTFQMRPNGS